MKQIHVYKVIQFLAFLMRMCSLFVVIVVIVVNFFAFSSSPTESLDQIQPTLYRALLGQGNSSVHKKSSRPYFNGNK